MKKRAFILFLHLLILQAGYAQKTDWLKRYTAVVDGLGNSPAQILDPRYIHVRRDSIAVRIAGPKDLQTLLVNNLSDRVYAVLFDASPDSLKIDQCFDLLLRFPKIEYLSFEAWGIFARNYQPRKIPIPEQIGQLPNLRFLRLKSRGDFDLTPVIPALAKAGRLKALALDLYGLPVPQSIKRIKSLTHVRLSSQNLASLADLNGLRWESIEVSGPAFKHTGTLPRLRSLQLQFPHADSIPAVWSLKQLRSLVLTATTPGKSPILAGLFRQLTNLEALSISSHADSADRPDGLGKLKHLRSLKLSRVASLDRDPGQFAQIGGLTGLMRLYISEQKAVPIDFSRLSHLQDFAVSGSAIRALPESLFRLPSVARMNLGSCQIDSLPDIPWNLPKLKVLGLRYGVLKSLPQAVTLLPSLENLDASSNQIARLPETGWERLRNLQRLDLSTNRLSLFPGGLQELSSLVFVDLSQNFIGTVPEFPRSGYQLHTLNLSGNNLVSLPASVGKFDSLQVLNLSGNKLTSIPESAGNLLNLRQLKITSDNRVHLVDWSKKGDNILTHTTDPTRINNIERLPAGLKNAASLAVLELAGNYGIDESSVMEVLLSMPRNNLNVNLADCGIDSLPATDRWKALTLTGLDLNCNRLRSLPPQFAEMKRFSNVIMNNNPIRVDPAICNRPINTQADMIVLYNEMGVPLSPAAVTPASYAKALTERVQDFTSRRNWKKGVDYAVMAINADRAVYESAVSWEDIGRCRYEIKDYAGAIADFQRFIQKERASRIHWAASLELAEEYKANAHEHLGQFREAADTHVLFARYFNHQSGWQKAAIGYLAMGDTATSRKLLDTALMTYKNQGEWNIKTRQIAQPGDVLDYAELLIIAGKNKDARELIGQHKDRMTGKYASISAYLLASATVAEDPYVFAQVKDTLDQEIRKTGKISGWDFRMYTSWLNASRLPSAHKKDLEELLLAVQ